MTDHSMCLTPIPMLYLELLPPGLTVLPDGALWESIGQWDDAEHSWMWQRLGDTKTRAGRKMGLCYPVGWLPPTSTTPRVYELPRMPPEHRWLAWSMRADTGRWSPYSYHPTEIEARAAAWDRDNPRKDT